MGKSSLDPQGWFDFKSNVFQDLRYGEIEGNTITSIERITRRSHRIQYDMTDVELLVDKYNMNKPGRKSINLGSMGRGVEGVGEEGN